MHEAVIQVQVLFIGGYFLGGGRCAELGPLDLERFKSDHEQHHGCNRFRAKQVLSPLTVHQHKGCQGSTCECEEQISD